MSELVFKITEDDTGAGCIAHAHDHSSVTAAGTREQLLALAHEDVLCHFDEGKASAVILENRPVAA